MSHTHARTHARTHAMNVTDRQQSSRACDPCTHARTHMHTHPHACTSHSPGDVSASLAGVGRRHKYLWQVSTNASKQYGSCQRQICPDPPEQTLSHSFGNSIFTFQNNQRLASVLSGVPPPPQGNLCYGTYAQEAISTKRRKKMGLSVAYKTIGAFPSHAVKPPKRPRGKKLIFCATRLCRSGWGIPIGGSGAATGKVASALHSDAQAQRAFFPLMAMSPASPSPGRTDVGGTAHHCPPPRSPSPSFTVVVRAQPGPQLQGHGPHDGDHRGDPGEGGEERAVHAGAHQPCAAGQLPEVHPAHQHHRAGPPEVRTWCAPGVREGGGVDGT